MRTPIRRRDLLRAISAGAGASMLPKLGGNTVRAQKPILARLRKY